MKPVKTDEDVSRKVFDTSCIDQTPRDLKEAESKLPAMKQNESAAINFTRLEMSQSWQSSYPTGSNPSEITMHSIDLSFKLTRFIEAQRAHVSPSSVVNQVLGELQFAFVCFLVGNVYDGFEQWKFLIGLLCNCEQSIRTEPEMFTALLNVLYYQLNEMPLDFFTDITTSNNFLVVHLHNLFENIRDVCAAETLSAAAASSNRRDVFDKMNKRCDQLKNYLEEKFKFDFDQEPDEYAPVICDDE